MLDATKIEPGRRVDAPQLLGRDSGVAQIAEDGLGPRRRGDEADVRGGRRQRRFERRLVVVALGGDDDGRRVVDARTGEVRDAGEHGGALGKAAPVAAVVDDGHPPVHCQDEAGQGPHRR